MLVVSLILSYIEYEFFKLKMMFNQNCLAQVGFLNADVIPELSSYETDSWVRYKWDTIQVFWYVVKSLLTLVYNVSLCHLSSVSSLAAEDTGMRKATLTGSTQVWGEPGSRTQTCRNYLLSLLINQLIINDWRHTNTERRKRATKI